MNRRCCNINVDLRVGIAAVVAWISFMAAQPLQSIEIGDLQHDDT